LRFAPPDGCEVYLIKDGIAVYARDFPPTDFTLRPIMQKRFDETLVTVFQQGRLQLSIERNGKLFIATLPTSFAPCAIQKIRSFFLLEGNGQILLFNERAELLISETVVEFSYSEDGITALLPLSDRLNRVAECRFEFTEFGVKQTEFSIRQTGESAEKIPENLLPYAFFESVCIGADFTQMLSPDLLEKASELRKFLGDFLSVTLKETPNKVGLIYAKAERLFEIRYYTVKIENGKICDITG
jgi:hypothetical protein